MVVSCREAIQLLVEATCALMLVTLNVHCCMQSCHRYQLDQGIRAFQLSNASYLKFHLTKYLLAISRMKPQLGR